MNTKTLMLETCRGLSPLWRTVERRDRALADQGRRAMQSMVLQYAEGLHAYGGNRTMKLLGARSEAHERGRAWSSPMLVDWSIHATGTAASALDRIAAILWLKVHRPR